MKIFIIKKIVLQIQQNTLWPWKLILGHFSIFECLTVFFKLRNNWATVCTIAEPTKMTNRKRRCETWDVRRVSQLNFTDPVWQLAWLRPVTVLNEQDLRTLDAADFKDKLLHRDGDTSCYNILHYFVIITFTTRDGATTRDGVAPKNCNRLKEIMRNVELYHTNLVGIVSRILINLPTSSLKSDNTVTVTTESHCVGYYGIVLGFIFHILSFCLFFLFDLSSYYKTVSTTFFVFLKLAVKLCERKCWYQNKFWEKTFL